MPTTFVNATQFNPAGVTADGLYIRTLTPNGFIQGVPADVAAIIGTASWGVLNTPVLMGTPTDLANVFGGVQAAAATDVFDMPTDALIAFSQASSPNTLSIYGVRISDTTDVKATYVLLDTTAVTPVASLPINAMYSGVLGNSISIVVAAGSKTNTFDVKIIPFGGSPPELFQGIVGNGTTAVNSPFWANLQSAINNGISGVRGPSKYVTAGTPVTTSKDPALGTFLLATGTDGRSAVASSNIIGLDSTGIAKTGIYSLRGVVSPPVGTMWCSGLTDSTVYTAIQSFVDSEGIVAGLCLPQGGTTTAAIATKKGYGIDDPNVIFVKDWIDFFDSVNSRVRRVQPTAFIMGAITCLSPEQSPSNKPVAGIVGTERGGANQPYQTYSMQELGQLASNGIMIVTKPNNGGSYWGMPHGRNSSSNGVTSPVEYARMINFLGKSFAGYLGKFVGQLQSIDPKDPVRAAVKLSVDQFLEGLKQNRQIDSYLSICDLTNNTPSTIAQHYLYLAVQVRFLSSIWYFVVSLEGGTTEVTVQNGLSKTLVS